MIAQLSKKYIIIGGLKKVFQRLLSYIFEGRPITTKGRFFNFFLRPIILLFLKLKYKNNSKTFFIVGQGRSGSTYLGLLLSLHRDYFFMNEPKLAWSISNSSDDLVGSYSKRGSYLIKNIDIDTHKKINYFYSIMSKLSGSKVIIDKYPELIFRKDWIRKNFPKSKFLILYRDYKSVIESIPNWNLKHSNINENWWGVNNRKWDLINLELIPNSQFLSNLKLDFKSINDIEKSLIEWILTVEESIKLINSRNYNFHVFNYDELETSINIYIKRENVKTDDFFKVRDFFESTFKKKTYEENSLSIDSCNDKLIFIADKLKSKFNLIWKRYSS